MGCLVLGSVFTWLPTILEGVAVPPLPLPLPAPVNILGCWTCILAGGVLTPPGPLGRLFDPAKVQIYHKFYLHKMINLHQGTVTVSRILSKPVSSPPAL